MVFFVIEAVDTTTVVIDYCDYSTFVIIALKIKIKCTLVIIVHKVHFTAQK